MATQNQSQYMHEYLVDLYTQHRNSLLCILYNGGFLWSVFFHTKLKKEIESAAVVYCYILSLTDAYVYIEGLGNEY